MHSHHGIAIHDVSFSLNAILLHTAALLIVSIGLAMAFYETYEKSGLSALRSSWFNFDLIWAVALLVAALVSLLL